MNPSLGVWNPPSAVWLAPAEVMPRQNSGGTTLAGAAPVMAVNWTVIRGAAPANLAFPVPRLFWRLLEPPLFPCSSINWNTVFCYGWDTGRWAQQSEGLIHIIPVVHPLPCKPDIGVLGSMLKHLKSGTTHMKCYTTTELHPLNVNSQVAKYPSLRKLNIRVLGYLFVSKGVQSSLHRGGEV